MHRAPIAISDRGMPAELSPALPGLAQRPSGIWVPVPGGGERPQIVLPAELEPAREFSIVVRRMPSADDQVRVWAEDEDFGLEESSLRETIERVREIGFEFGMVVLSRLAALIGQGTSSVEQQLFAIDQFFIAREDKLAAAHVLLRRGRMIFCEQHINRLARLLILHAPERPVGEPTAREQWLIQRTMIGMGSLVEHGDKAQLHTRDDAIAWLVQAGAYNSTEPIVEALQRVKAIYVELAQRPDLRNENVPLSDWAVEDQKLSIEQQWAIAIAAFGRANVFDDDASPLNRGMLPADFITQFATAVGASERVVADALVGDRAWYHEQFAPGAGDYQQTLWNRIPFEQRPLLRLRDGRLLVLSPRALLSWLTDGFYHRASNSARARGNQTRGRFGNYIGNLVETYALELMRSVHPGRRLPGSGVVHGDRTYAYAGGVRRTPDIAIDRGHDLVLIEVCSGRLSVPTLVEGDVRSDLETKLIGKARQLSDRVDDLLDGHATIDDVDPDVVHRVWPIVIAPSGLLQHPMLWDYIFEGLGDKLTRPRVQPLTIIDLADLECLAGLIESGTDLIEILKEKTGTPYRHLDLRRLISEDPRFDAYSRASLVLRRSDEMWRTAGAHLGLDEDELRRLQEARPAA